MLLEQLNQIIELPKEGSLFDRESNQHQRIPTKCSKKERELELRRTEPIPTRSATAMLIEKVTDTDQRLPGGEGAIGVRQQQHAKPEKKSEEVASRGVDRRLRGKGQLRRR